MGVKILNERRIEMNNYQYKKLVEESLELHNSLLNFIKKKRNKYIDNIRGIDT